LRSGFAARRQCEAADEEVDVAVVVVVPDEVEASKSKGTAEMT
jgi:microcompartment protein CcmK/EutM